MCAAALHLLQVPRIVFGAGNDHFGGCGTVFDVQVASLLTFLLTILAARLKSTASLASLTSTLGEIFTLSCCLRRISVSYPTHAMPRYSQASMQTRLLQCCNDFTLKTIRQHPKQNRERSAGGRRCTQNSLALKEVILTGLMLSDTGLHSFYSS